MARRNPSDTPDFYRHDTLDALSALQGVNPVDPQKWLEMKAIADELWPDEKSVEDFQAFIRELRGKGPLPGSV